MPLFPRTPQRSRTTDFSASVPANTSTDDGPAPGLRSSPTPRSGSSIAHIAATVTSHPLGSPDRDALPVARPSLALSAESGEGPSLQGPEEPTPASIAVRPVVTRKPSKRKAPVPDSSDPPISEVHRGPTSAKTLATTRKPRERKTKTAVPVVPMEPTPSATDGETISGRGGRLRKAPKTFTPDD